MTREDINVLLSTNDRAVARALVVLYERQTDDEKGSGVTKHSNGAGFNATDASFGTALAQWVLSGKRLSAGQLASARRMLGKYSGQLLAIAKAKQGPPEVRV